MCLYSQIIPLWSRHKPLQATLVDTSLLPCRLLSTFVLLLGGMGSQQWLGRAILPAIPSIILIFLWNFHLWNVSRFRTPLFARTSYWWKGFISSYRISGSRLEDSRQTAQPTVRLLPCHLRWRAHTSSHCPSFYWYHHFINVFNNI